MLAQGFAVTNTKQAETIDEIKVTKIWDDANNQDGVRPAEVTVELVADGTPTGDKVTLNEANNWTAIFTNVVKNKVGGGAIVYTVKEDPVAGYAVGVVTGNVAAGFEITNSYTPGKTSVKVTKVWDDADNQDGERYSRSNSKIISW